MHTIAEPAFHLPHFYTADLLFFLLVQSTGAI
jgi:hypothetical protein